MPAHRKYRVCDVEGCGGKHVAGGLCEKHRARNRRRGDLEVTRRPAGTGTITAFGYLAVGTEKTLAHVAIAEAALGRPLPPGAEVHHVNENKLDNRPENLVICPSRQYHFMLHQRMRALAACGNAGFRKCPFCKQYDDPNNMKESKHGRHFYHRNCRAAYARTRAAHVIEQRPDPDGATIRR